MLLQDSERLDDLQLGDLKIIQDKNKYNFTSDSALLANFISTKKLKNSVTRRAKNIHPNLPGIF